MPEKHGTAISWTHFPPGYLGVRQRRGRTWNPLRGCSQVSPGCGNCYAKAHGGRFYGEGQPFHGFVKRVHDEPHWTGRVELMEHKLTEPMGWADPSSIFTCSMSDIFHEALTDEQIDEPFGTMAACLDHIFLALTKRAMTMRKYLNARGTPHKIWSVRDRRARDRGQQSSDPCWPLPNVWLGVSVEHPDCLWRLDELRATPGGHRLDRAAGVSLRRLRGRRVREAGLRPLPGPPGAPPGRAVAARVSRNRIRARPATHAGGWVMGDVVNLREWLGHVDGPHCGTCAFHADEGGNPNSQEILCYRYPPHAEFGYPVNRRDSVCGEFAEQSEGASP